MTDDRDMHRMMRGLDVKTLARVLRVACPDCGAGQGERCRTYYRGNETDPHRARRRWALVYEARLKESAR